MDLPSTEPDVDVAVGRNGSYRVWHDPWDDDVCVTLTRALAAINDADEAAVSTALAEHVDPDGLNRIFRPHDGGGLGTQRDHVAIEIEGYDITIHPDGLIEIDP